MTDKYLLPRIPSLLIETTLSFGILIFENTLNKGFTAKLSKEFNSKEDAENNMREMFDVEVVKHNHFKNFYDNVSYPISLARGAYWLGKSYQMLGNDNKSNNYFKEGSKFLTTYYGQLSFNEINNGGEFKLDDQTSFNKEY